MILGLDRVTVAPGRGVPSSSETVPTIAPVSLDWEKQRGERIKSSASSEKTTFTFIIPPFNIFFSFAKEENYSIVPPTLPIEISSLLNYHLLTLVLLLKL
jgi:hypothetical protein